MKETRHMSTSIRGALKNLENKRSKTKTYFQHEDGRFATVAEARVFLALELQKGHEFLPMSECDNFDYKKGCLGHKTEDEQ